MRTIVVALGILCVSFGDMCFADERQAVMTKAVVDLNNGLKLHHMELRNGLRLLVVPNDFAPVFTYRTVFFVGSKDERTGKRGIAHLFEHMMFRETKNLKNGEFDLRVTRLGGVHLNAYTTADSTVYIQSLPAPFLEDIMKLESDRMANLIINKPRLEEERGAVIGEFHAYLNNPRRMFFKSLNEMMYEKHPYRFEVIGTEPEIKGFTVEDCLGFYRSFYAPNNAAIVVIGDVDPKNVATLANRYYGALKPQPSKRARIPKEPPQKKKKVMSILHPYASQVEMGLAVKLLDVKASDLPYLLVLEELLGGNSYSLAYQSLVQEGLGTSVSSYLDLNPVGNPAAFYFSATLAPGVSKAKIQKAVEQLFLRLRRRPVSEKKIRMAVNQVKLQYFVESNEALASLVLAGLNYKNDPAFIFSFFYDRFLKTKFSPKRLMQIVKKYLRSSDINILFMAPGTPKAEKKKSS